MLALVRSMRLVCFFLLLLSCAYASQPPKTLVIIMGQTRAHEFTAQNIKENLIDVLHADLAICVGNGKEECVNNPFYQQAKYQFTYDEPFEYSQALDDAYATIIQENGLKEIPINWRQFLTIPGNFLGGVQEGDAVRAGSGAISLFLRWFLLKNLLKHNLLDEYDFFVITRSDYIYTLPHPNIELFTTDSLYIPDGEHHGGVTDRHVVVPKGLITKHLDMLTQMVLQADNYYTKNQHHTDLNLERFILFHLTENQLEESVRYFPYVMYTIKGPNDPTRWSAGVFSPEHDYFIKYPLEYDLAMQHKKDFEATGNADLHWFYQQRINSKKKH